MVIMPDPPLEDITGFFKNDIGITVSMLRLDKVHPVISGNKWYKLNHNLAAALDMGFGRTITFGGAYSNHLIATAGAAKDVGIKAIGIVRGLHAAAHLTPTLQACKDLGMELHFVSREDYALKDDPVFLQSLTGRFGPSFIIPEGGDNELGRTGTADIAAFIPATVTHVCLPVGTGTTLTGIRNALSSDKEIVGFTAMKGGGYLQEKIAAHIRPGQSKNWHLETGYAFNGFAKTTPALIQFMRSFYSEAGIPLDIVYTGKMMFGIRDMIQTNTFPENASIACIHTGGLQGNPPDLFK